MKNLFKRIFATTGENLPNTNEIFIWHERTMETRKEKSVRKLGLRVISNIHDASVSYYLPEPEIATGTALVIAPGGGHKELWIEHEGYNIAKKFCEMGIASFVLKYRLSQQPGSKYSLHEHSLADIQQAIRYIRHHASKWNINPSSIGVMGFSAGGELAGLAAKNFDDGDKNASDKILQQNSYPDFQALIYPSDTKQFKPTKNSPPLFLLAGEKDEEIAADIKRLYSLYKEENISAELHLYPNEYHGFGIRKNNSKTIQQWPEVFKNWLIATGLIKQ